MKVEGMNMNWTPEYNERYYMPCFYIPEDLFDSYSWRGDATDLAIQRNVGIYRTKEEAIAKAKELGWT
jgi:hypothetical protein